MKQLFTLFLLLATTLLLAQPTLVKDINPGSENASPTRFFPYGNQLIFRANDGQLGVEPWITDGTEAGTMMIQDINPGDTVSQGNSNPDNFILYNDLVYFKARSASFGDELFVTDGTDAGTSLIKDIQEGSGNSNPFDMILFNDLIYFTANDGVNSSELWSSDGTTEGTNLVVDIRPGNAGNPINKTIFGDKIIFTGNDGTNGAELWITDGTAEGTSMVKDIREGSANSLPSQFFVFNGEVYFRANDGVNGNELWKTDGTEAGTVLVKDIREGSGNSAPSDFFVAGGNLYFVADDGNSGKEIWTTDGTEAGTQMLMDINPGGGSDPGNFFPILDGQIILFTADDGLEGNELYSLIVDEEGIDIELLADINPGNGSSNPRDFVFTGAALYFSAETDAFGRELYEFLINEEVPQRVSDIFSGEGSSNIANLTRVGRSLFFAATDTVVGTELYTYAAQTAEVTFNVGPTFYQSGDTIDLGSSEVGLGGLIDISFFINSVGTGTASIIEHNANELSDPFGGLFLSSTFDSIPATQSSELVIGFFPVEEGNYLDSFYLDIPQLNGSVRNTFYVKASAQLPAPEVAIVRGSDTALNNGDNIDFGELFLTQEAEETITIRNAGTAALEINSITLSETTQFSLLLGEVPSVLEDGDSFTFTVRYAPQEQGAHTASITIDNTASDAPGFVINLSGSAIISSVNEFGIQAAQAYPNPTDQFFLLELAEPLQDAQFRLTDLQGRVVQQGSWPQGADRQRFDLSRLAAGLYHLEVRSGAKRLVLEIVKR